ncbi:hypothetical protein [Bradyrhizobium sp. SZCCHNS3055]|uniref:hypothetical protein n=1 Tax=Bradyrhizobium sp. SZCCHNS3055 TaxID=3057323 RepID=UPI0028E78247|nr:hypothetical protein [Bradyrhizobium sp. SZCCHNS3055]
MKLENFEKVGSLIKRRNYLESLKALSVPSSRMRIAHLDVAPDVAERLWAEMRGTFDVQIKIIDCELVGLGVSITEQEAA